MDLHSRRVEWAAAHFEQEDLMHLREEIMDANYVNQSIPWFTYAFFIRTA